MQAENLWKIFELNIKNFKTFNINTEHILKDSFLHILKFRYEIQPKLEYY